MIRNVRAIQLLDSQGNPTIKVYLITDAGRFCALVPSGLSRQQYEAVELRDGDPDVYRGLGVQKAVRNVEEIIGPALIERQFDTLTDLRAIDKFLEDLDGTPDSSRLGANAILGVSMACARAGAAAAGIPLYEFLSRQANVKGFYRHGAKIKGRYILPVPFFNFLNGGLHSGDTMAFQEIMVAPVGARSFSEAMRMGSEIHHCFKHLIYHSYGPSSIGVGDEGGFSPHVRRPEQGMNLLENAIDKCGYSEKTKFAIHAASPEFFREEDCTYDLGFPDKEKHILTPHEMQGYYKNLIADYPIVLLEDPFSPHDWKSWVELNEMCDIEIVGDSLLSTNPDRIRWAAEKKACNSLLLKLNQIGSVTRAIDAAKLAFSYGWSVFVSHRAGEAVDDFIADLAVAIGAGHLKSGAPFGGERLAKYNRLLEIEAELKSTQVPFIYAGQNFRFSRLQ